MAKLDIRGVPQEVREAANRLKGIEKVIKPIPREGSLPYFAFVCARYILSPQAKSAARRKALEEAAEVADGRATHHEFLAKQKVGIGSMLNSQAASEAEHIAQVIRALLDKEPT